MREKNLTRLLWPLLALTLPLVLSGCESALMDPKGQIGLEQRTLILTAFGLMLIVVIPVIVMTFLFAFRYRFGKQARYEPDWAHSNVIETVVWFIPLVIIAFLGWITWQTSHSLDPHKPLESDVKPLEIQAVSLDWKWLFIYPQQGIATVNEVAFPANVPVHFRVSSGSVMNSFFIPRLGSQIYAMAGMDNDVHLIADEEGVYPGRSTNYSGAGFAGMTFKAHAVSQDGFDAWVDKVHDSSDTLIYPSEYETLARPTRNNPIEYYSEVTPELYEKIVRSFHTGNDGEKHGAGHENGSMSAEAAE
ncbi:ubiquinol oxidase subunit II [Pistricoccus aurantiacus]|uniref:Ubiquinol oxidase subunit 2 n=1 Tax=Pistricoccus aurantiacus TaxID=1883414 RepID=A0A5B8SX41_9GAMM|nr:ubiquinol oxidase subunit II [Pistricoccus aurantiacus]QEA39350.1 ubiquinol oxidase subunit II [Pistricoccus aurantiacus]